MHILKTIALAAMLIVPTFAHAQQKVALPDTPAGRTFADWLAAVNSGDREKMRAFHLEHSRGTDEDRQRADKHSAMDYNAYGNSGGFDLVRVGKSTDTEIEVEIAGRAGGPNLSVWFKVTADPPYVIEAGAIRPTSGGSSASASMT
jgi:hypothetical protein